MNNALLLKFHIINRMSHSLFTSILNHRINVLEAHVHITSVTNDQPQQITFHRF